MSIIYNRYKKIIKLPAGRFIFNKAVGLSAPFFRHISPNIIELRPGYCESKMKNRWGVRNHLGTINAGALCSMAEMTGGMALDSIVPDTLRWIPSGMTVAYIKKATGTITAVSELAKDDIQEGDLVVPIVITNLDGETVFTAHITFYISSKA